MLAGVCLLLYARTLGAPFVLDDFDNILHNPEIRWNELSLEGMVDAALGPPVRRPVAHLTFGLNHWLGGYQVTGYRLFNLAVHAANGLLVYALALGVYRRLGARRDAAGPRLAPGDVAPAALAAALLFVAHPLQIQSVTYVVQRMNSLAAGFYLAALLLWLRAASRPNAAARTGLRSAAVACGLLALGSKEIAVTLPLAVLLYQAWWVHPHDRDWLRRRLPLLILLLAAAGAGLLYFAGSARYRDLDFSAGERLLTQARVVWLYLSLVVLPLPSRLNLLHTIEPSRSLLDPPSTLLALAGLVAIGGWALWGRRRWPLASFAILWFLLHLALESSTLPLRMIFEHRTYLPLAGLVLWLPHVAFARLGRRRAWPAVALLLVPLCAATLLRNETWRSWETLWEDVVAKSPEDPLAQMQRATLLALDGRYAEALTAVDESIRIDPRAARPRGLRGAVLTALERPEEALRAFREAQRLAPRDPQYRARAAETLVALGRLDEAAHELEAALELRADEDWVHRLGRIRQQQGRTDEAIALYQQAAAMNPRHQQAREDAGLLLAEQGRPLEAAASFREALALGPSAELHARLGGALWEAGRYREALDELEASLALEPVSPATRELAWMLATCPDPDLRDPERALRLLRTLPEQGGSARLLDTWAAALAAAGRFEEAVTTADRALVRAREAGDLARARAIEARRALYAQGVPPIDAGSETDAGAH
jgi:tetratricopeptide (TPR) repeat protein